MAQEIFAVCNKVHRNPIIAADTYERAEIELKQLAKDFCKEESDYYIVDLSFYTSD